MPEEADQYIWAEILFTRKDQMARGHVVAQMPIEVFWVELMQILYWIQDYI